MAPRFDKLLVLDMDETLLHTIYVGDIEGPDSEPDHYLNGGMVTWERPGVRTFLTWAFENFRDVGLWTAGTLPYAMEVLPLMCDVDRFSFVWGRERCTYRRSLETYEETYLKDIRKLRKRGFDRRKILAVDDSPEKFSRSYGNYIYIPPFEGDPGDDLLPRLAEYLEELGDVPNVRTVEKRGWYR